MYLQAQQSLEDVLALGLTYDDLIAEGMHPRFLDQLFSRIKPQSPSNTSRETSLPQPTATPDPFQSPQHPIPVKAISQQRLVSDVDNFLDNLEPSISTPRDGDNSKKRGLSADTAIHPPKRRAFGLLPPKELVIDVSDDDDDDDEEDHHHHHSEHGSDNHYAEPPTLSKPLRPVVKITERPALTQKVLTLTSTADCRTSSKP
jgi:hypothetical protein